MIIGSWPGTLKGNPFLDILATSLENLGARFIPVDRPSKGILSEVDALLIQWPEQIFWKARRGRIPYRAAFSELRALWKWRRSGKKLIWIVHNAVPHDLNPQQRRLWLCYARALCALSHGYMTLSPATQSTVLRHHPGLSRKPASSFRHPAYTVIARSLADRVARRRELGIGAETYVIGALGRIGDYKGIPDLIEAFSAIKDDRIRLLICGQPKSATARAEIEIAAVNDPRICYCLDFLSHDDFDLTAAACDAVVAPYRQYLHSGTLIYLTSAERRSLTPRTPFAEDLANCVGPGWITLYDGRITSNLLSEFIAAPLPRERPDLAALNPNLSAKEILNFLRTI